jgi:hypothetical protein
MVHVQLRLAQVYSPYTIKYIRGDNEKKRSRLLNTVYNTATVTIRMCDMRARKRFGDFNVINCNYYYYHDAPKIFLHTLIL